MISQHPSALDTEDFPFEWIDSGEHVTAGQITFSAMTVSFRPRALNWHKHVSDRRRKRIAASRSIRNEVTMTIKDNGPKPQSFDIETATKENRDYRSVAWSGRHLQLTLMSIPVGGDIGLEAHPETDQLLRLDAGQGRVQMGPTKDDMPFEQDVSNGWCVLVPAGTWHNITNIGVTPMQVHAIYAPAHHKPGKVHATSAVAQADQDDKPADWSVQGHAVPDQHG